MGDRAEAHLHHLVDEGDQQDDAGPLALVGNEAPQPEDDGPLVLAQDLDGRRQDEQREDQDRHDVEGGFHASSWQRQAGWPDARSTRSLSPSTPTTRTRSPAGMPGTSATAVHSSPWTSTWPSGSSGVFATPVSWSSPAAPVVGRCIWARTPAETANTKMPAVSATTGMITVHATRSGSSGVFTSIIEPSRIAMIPPIVEDAVAHDLDLGDQEHDPEEDEEESRPVDRQTLEGEERQDERDATDHARKDDARVRELEEEAQHAEHQEDVGDVRVGDQPEEPVAPPDGERLDGRPARVEGDRPPGRLHLPAVDLLQEARGGSRRPGR